MSVLKKIERKVERNMVKEPLQLYSYVAAELPHNKRVAPPEAPDGHIWVPQNVAVCDDRLVVVWQLASTERKQIQQPNIMLPGS